MNKEAYVSFQIAKLLKEKGFDWKCLAVYVKSEETSILHVTDTLLDYNDNSVKQCISCPTQQMACRWLREEKGMYISVVPDFNEYGEYPDDLYWFARIYDLRNGDYIHSTKLYIGSHEAFESALQYCLTNLI